MGVGNVRVSTRCDTQVGIGRSLSGFSLYNRVATAVSGFLYITAPLGLGAV